MLVNNVLGMFRPNFVRGRATKRDVFNNHIRQLVFNLFILFVKLKK